MGRKVTYEEVKKGFYKYNISLITEEKDYKSTSQKLRIKCNECDGEDSVSFHKFKRRKNKCINCSDITRWTYDKVYELFKENDCTLLESCYINNETPMKFVCKCGEEDSIRLAHFLNGSRCNKCGTRKRIQKRKRSLEQIKSIYSDNGCELLEESYKNREQEMKFVCKCGEVCTKTLAAFEYRPYCHECSEKSNELRIKYNEKLNSQIEKMVDIACKLNRIPTLNELNEKGVYPNSKYIAKYFNENGYEDHFDYLFNQGFTHRAYRKYTNNLVKNLGDVKSIYEKFHKENNRYPTVGDFRDDKTLPSWNKVRTILNDEKISLNEFKVKNNFLNKVEHECKFLKSDYWYWVESLKETMKKEKKSVSKETQKYGLPYMQWYMDNYPYKKNQYVC